MKTIGRKMTGMGSLFQKGCLKLVFIYAEYSKCMQEKTGFGIKDCSLLYFLRWKFFIDERVIGKGDEKVLI